jgi:hypothetical protein
MRSVTRSHMLAGVMFSEDCRIKVPATTLLAREQPVTALTTNCDVGHGIALRRESTLCAG